MTIDYTRLRELAEAATKGEWEYDGHEGVCSQDGDMHRSVAYPFKAADAAHIAAANPAVVLGLLDALEAERARGDAAEADARTHIRRLADGFADARAWAAWFAAERDWKLDRMGDQTQALCDDWAAAWEKCLGERDDALERIAVLEGVVAEVRQLHAPEESAITKLFCPVCSEDEYLEPWPCETVRILDQAERDS